MLTKLTQNEIDKIKQNIDQAINDWPEKVDSYKDYIEKIKISLGIDKADKLSIIKFMETNNPLKFAWIFESLESILTIKELDQNTLEEIINSLDLVE